MHLPISQPHLFFPVVIAHPSLEENTHTTEINDIVMNASQNQPHEGELVKIQEMLEHIRAGHQKFLDAAEAITSYSAGQSPEKPKKRESPPSLSKRQTEIIKLLSQGHSKHKIAEQLNITSSTVATHARHIFKKLGVSNASGAVGKAFRCGILSLDD